MLVHFICDDKFIDMALREFEAAAPGEHVAVTLSPPPHKYVKSQAVRSMTLEAAMELVRAPTCRAVLFHSLPPGHVQVLRMLPPDKLAIWLGWGYDYYERLLAKAHPNGLLLPQTARLQRRLDAQPAGRSFVSSLRSMVDRARARLQDRLALPRVDVFSPVLESEHALACRLNPWFRPRYVRWNYGTLEDDFSAQAGAGPLGDDVLVGNSAYGESNHLEAFELLKESFEVGPRRIIVPLSYGDQRYAQAVMDAGRRIFGQQFVPITDFLEKDQYLRLLDSCGFVVMNHLRQQALGTIYIMLFKGARLYLRPENPLYAWLAAQGAHVDRFDAKAQQAARHFTPLSAQQKAANAAAVQASTSRQAQQTRTRELVALAMGGRAAQAPQPAVERRVCPDR